MKIIINGNHTEKLASALETIQARCTARTLTADRIEDILNSAASKLGISKKAMAGTKLVFTGAKQFPNAYKGIPESTHFTAEHNGRFWVITDITRSTCPDRAADTHLTLSESAKAALLERYAYYQS